MCVPPPACRSIIYNAKLLHHHKYVRRTLVVVPWCALTVCFSHIAQSASEWLGGVIWNRRARTHVLFYLSLSVLRNANVMLCAPAGVMRNSLPGRQIGRGCKFGTCEFMFGRHLYFYSSGRQEKVHSVFFYSIDEKDLRLKFFNLIITFRKFTITNFSHQTQSGAFINMVVIESLFSNFVILLQIYL